MAILNSNTVREKASKWQSEGQFGKRDFDKTAFNLPIPKYDASIQLHRDLVEEAKHAAKVAAAVPLAAGQHFGTARRNIRTALVKDGCSARIDALVNMLLSQASKAPAPSAPPQKTKERLSNKSSRERGLLI